MSIFDKQKEATAHFLSHYQLTPSILKETFIRESQNFVSDSFKESTASNFPRPLKKRSRLDEEIYGNRSSEGSVTSELNRYLGEMT